MLAAVALLGCYRVADRFVRVVGGEEEEGVRLRGAMAAMVPSSVWSVLEERNDFC